MKKLIILSTICMLVLCGCQSKNAIPSSNSQTTESQLSADMLGTTASTEEATSSWTETEETELYNTYVNIYNEMLKSLSNTMNNYFEDVAYEEEFALLEGSTEYSINKVNDSLLENIQKASEQLEKKEDKDSLDQSFLQLTPALTGLIESLNEISEYTELKLYFDDNFEKGKELHRGFWSSFNEYASLAETYQTELGAMEKVRRKEELQRFKDEGLDTLYAVNMMMMAAMDIQEELYLQEITNENILDMDMEKIQPLYDEFVKYVDEAATLSLDEAKLTEEGIPTYTSNWPMLIDYMKQTKVSLTAVLENVKNQEPLNEIEMMMSIPGNCSLSAFDAGVSYMISCYNNLLK